MANAIGMLKIQEYFSEKLYFLSFYLSGYNLNSIFVTKKRIYKHSKN